MKAHLPFESASQHSTEKSSRQKERAFSHPFQSGQMPVKALFSAVSEDVLRNALCINLAYLWSKLLYPTSMASRTARTVSSFGILNIPNPAIGIRTPLFKVTYSISVASFKLVRYHKRQKRKQHSNAGRRWEYRNG